MEGTSPIVSLTEHLSGRQSGAVAFGAESPYLQSLGMEAVTIGPGFIDQAHQPDEYLALDRMQSAIDLYRNIIGQTCLLESGVND